MTSSQCLFEGRTKQFRWSPASLPTGCVTFDRLVDLSGSCFLHLCSGENSRHPLAVVSLVIWVKCVGWCRPGTHSHHSLVHHFAELEAESTGKEFPKMRRLGSVRVRIEPPPHSSRLLVRAWLQEEPSKMPHLLLPFQDKSAALTEQQPGLCYNWEITNAQRPRCVNK